MEKKWSKRSSVTPKAFTFLFNTARLQFVLQAASVKSTTGNGEGNQFNLWPNDTLQLQFQ